jgi:hypothetical protein
MLFTFIREMVEELNFCNMKKGVRDVKDERLSNLKWT